MVVSVDFHGLQRRLTQAERVQVPLTKGKRVTDVMEYLMASYPELPLSENHVLVTVNNQITSLDQVLEADDNISFIPHIGGG